MPPKTVASLLSNESNLRILERLKARPYYPRELAAEMKLSEPFIVRRLKAMEEYDIVEGRWETEDGRRIKRYYVKDVTMQLGKGGLEVTAGSIASDVRGNGYSLRRDILRYLIYLPVLLAAEYFMFTHDLVPYAAIGLLLAWYVADILAFYRNYRHNALIASAFVLGMLVVAEVITITVDLSGRDPIARPDQDVGYIWLAWAIVVIAGYALYIRFIQADARDLRADKEGFVSGLDTAPAATKLFYLPLAAIWDLNEYFGLR